MLVKFQSGIWSYRWWKHKERNVLPVMKKEEESAVSQEETQTCRCKQSVCVCGCGSETRKRAALPDGFERKVNPRLRASARVIDGSACPRITTQHNRDAGTHLEISLALPLYTCGHPTRSFTCVIRTWFGIRFKVCLTCHHLASALASRLFGIFCPPPSLHFCNAPSQQMSVLLKLFKSCTIAELQLHSPRQQTPFSLPCV